MKDPKKEVAHWRKTIADLNRQREDRQSRIEALNRSKSPVTLRAHTGDDKAREKLDAVNTELLSERQALEDVEEAIRQAESKLATAQEAVAAEREAERLRTLAGLAEMRVGQAGEVDKCARALAVALGEYHATGVAITRQLGQGDQDFTTKVISPGRAAAAIAEELGGLLPNVERNPNDPRANQALADLEEQTLARLLVTPEGADKIAGVKAA